MFKVLKHDRFVCLKSWSYDKSVNSKGHNSSKEIDIRKKHIKISVILEETTISLTKESTIIKREIKWLRSPKL